MVARPEIALALLHDVELGAFVEILHQLHTVGGFRLVHRLGENLERVVVAPGLVLGRLAVALGEIRDELFRRGRVDEVMPDHRPSAQEIALAGAQASAVSKPKPATGNCNPYSVYCLTKLVICVPARFATTRSGRACRILSK